MTDSCPLSGGQRVLLVDVDSKISNLALMKLSAHHKARGDEVVLYRHRGRKSLSLDVTWEPSKVYLSCVFAWNRPTAIALSKMFPGAEVSLGGSGMDYGKPAGTWGTLPLEIEYRQPDYSLYGYDYAVGFCNRGCNRKCQFCIVPVKEGTIKVALYRPPWTWVPEGFGKAALLDNDIALYDYERQKEIFEWFTHQGVKHSVTQGYDIREVAKDPRLAALVADNMPWDLAFSGRRLYIAYDYFQNEPPVRKGLKFLLEAGVRPRAISCYVLVGFNTTHEQDLQRVRMLHEEFGVEPFVMIYNNRRDDPWLRALARWCNRPALRRTIPFSEYDRLPGAA